jgi:YD repeat-containing protein
VWASFGWGSAQMQPSFGEVVGTFAGENVLALNFVGFDDGSYTRFNYNGYAQVREIKHFASDSNPASDNHLLSTTLYDYGASDDPTRITDMRVSAENWTAVNGVPAEVVNQFVVAGNVHQMIAPDGTISKEFYGGTGSSPIWQHGLVIATQVLTGSTVQKSTATSWTQDDANASYQTNPRVYQTDVSDSANHRKTTIGYQTFTLPTTNASCSLPNEIYEYAADQTNVLRRTHTDYDLTANYVNDYHRIIGLPLTKLLYEGTSTLRSKTTYLYDQSEFMQNTAASAIQHDDFNYSTGFVIGRGNVTKVIHWDVDDPSQTAKAENKIGYDITGNVLFTRDALDHQTSINYADAFSIDGTSLDGPRSFATFAYPTTITDADGFSSTLWYRYDFGAKTRVQGPPPQNQANGIIQTTSYDAAARVQRVTTTNTGAYTHYVYGPNYTQSFSSVNAVATNYWESDLYSIQYFDGLGRIHAAASNHPGSQGGYKAQWTESDVMGRASRVSNPTEIDGSWNPIGDDVSGRVYTSQSYDWKGRPLVTTHETDGTTKYASYEGCGCAGGQLTTLTDERGRRQRIYSDVLGRAWKTEVLNWTGTVYSTTETTLNARDQATLVRQFNGNDQSGVYQDTTMSYDGYGRLSSQHVPEQQDQSGNPTYTTWSYNPDNTLYSVTDARGASAAYVYNNYRRLVNEIHYSAPSGIVPTSNVSFSYDAMGNRTSMTDALGSKAYSYDQLSRLMSETRTFSGIATFTLVYDYNLAGELKKITDSTNMTINYHYDAAGKLSDDVANGLNAVTGSGNLYAGVSNYASNIKYRAWGGLKAMTDGKGYVSTLGYNGKLQPSSFQISGNLVSQTYDYYDDGRISFVHNTSDANFDRAYAFDHLGRFTSATSGGTSIRSLECLVFSFRHGFLHE